MARIRLKVNGTIPGHPPGSVVEVEADDDGVPRDLHWRRRLADAASDKCVEVVSSRTSVGPRRRAREEEGE